MLAKMHQMHHCRNKNACTNKRYEEKKNAAVDSIIKNSRPGPTIRVGWKINKRYAMETVRKYAIPRYSIGIPKNFEYLLVTTALQSEPVGHTNCCLFLFA